MLGEALERFSREANGGTVNTGRTHCPYFVWGEGAPLVFLHGLADTSRSFLLLMAYLSRHFRCIAYDLPMGPEFAHYRHADLVRDLWSVLDHVGAKQAYVYAMSFGSTIALSAMREQPQRLLRGILQAPVAYKPLSRTERCFAWLMRRLPGTMSQMPLRLRLLRKMHQGPFEGRSPELWDHFLECGDAIPTHIVGRQARLLHEVDLRPILSEIRQPILLVNGDRDPIVSVSAMEEMERQLPNAGHVILEGSGHVPTLTHPEILTQVIRLFLTPPVPCADATPCSGHDGRIPLADCIPRPTD